MVCEGQRLTDRLKGQQRNRQQDYTRDSRWKCAVSPETAEVRVSGTELLMKTYREGGGGGGGRGRGGGGEEEREKEKG